MNLIEMINRLQSDRAEIAADCATSGIERLERDWQHAMQGARGLLDQGLGLVRDRGTQQAATYLVLALVDGWENDGDPPLRRWCREEEARALLAQMVCGARGRLLESGRVIVDAEEGGAWRG